MLRRLLPLVLPFALSLHVTACSDDAPSNGDASIDGGLGDGGDAAADLGPLPDGPRGAVLSVPETGRRTLPTLSGDVQVVYTEGNVPHIYAANERDLYVASGFVVARDRYFTFELGRRLAQGKLSELLGDVVLASDQTSRGRGMPEVAARIWSQLSAEQADLFTAYAEGINAYVEGVKARSIPGPSELEFAAPLLGYRNAGQMMNPVTGQDVVAFTAVLVFQLGFEGIDLTRQTVDDRLATSFESATNGTARRQGAITDLWSHVAPMKEVSSAPAGLGLEDGTTEARATPRRRRRNGRRRDTTPNVPTDVLARLDAHNAELDRVLHGGRGIDFGSNAWAVMGRATTDGATLLAGDGHLPLSVPTLFYQIGLDTAVFGEGQTTLLGLAFAGYPFMAVGTNGRIAWSQTYLDGDVTDWYAEELQLDDNGLPIASRFRGEWRPLVATDESYTIANIALLNSVGRTETWKTFSTFDGRRIVAVEGRVATADEVLADGETLINVLGDLVVPGDLDGDEKITAVSFDFTGFDVSNLPQASLDFARSENVRDFREATKRLVAYAQNLVAADREGGVYYSGYNATPCRGYLPKEDGKWVAGANPQRLLDGTTYGGFRVPLAENGLPDEDAGTSDPYACVIPFDAWPASLSPSRGYVLTANNDIGNLAFDDSLSNDAHYFGGPWAPGFRALTIDERLSTLVSASTASVPEMAELQGDHRSRFGSEVTEIFLQTIERANELSLVDRPLNPDEARLVAIFTSERASILEVQSRLSAWLDRGANAASGVATFYETPTADDRDDAVATMLFNQWFRESFRAIFADEELGYLFDTDKRFLVSWAMKRVLEGRGESNPLSLASWDETTGESVFFDELETTDVIERSDEVLLGALARALALLRAPQTSPGVGGFGTTDMNAWLWGLRHLVQLPSIVTQYGGDDPMLALLSGSFSITPSRLPLAPDLASTDPRSGLPGFPRPGDFFAVDAANPPFDGDNFFYTNGPVMRMVIALHPDGRVTGQNVVPGGQSGVTRSDYYADQAALWLGNETLPLSFGPEEVRAAAIGREVLSP